jgi:hypothetical protein
MEARMTHSRYFRDPPSIAVVKRMALAVVLAHATLASISAYRAWVQIRSLDLRVSRAVLGPGTAVDAQVVSWARTWVSVRVELVQDGRVSTLARVRVPPNHEGVYDPRWRRASLRVGFTAARLEPFHPGPALVRATALGGPQWLRTPPPRVREVGVQIPSRPEATP